MTRRHARGARHRPARGDRLSWARRPVLRGIDLTVRRGEVVALLGANGSGKSTAVRAVVGQVPLSGGELELFGTPLRRFRDWAASATCRSAPPPPAACPPPCARSSPPAGWPARGFGRSPRADRAAVDRALDLVGMADRARDSGRRALRRPAPAGADRPRAGRRAGAADHGRADGRAWTCASQEVLAETLRDQVAAGAHGAARRCTNSGPLEPLIDRAVVLRDGRVVARRAAARAPRPARAARPRPRTTRTRPRTPTGIRTGLLTLIEILDYAFMQRALLAALSWSASPPPPSASTWCSGGWR